MKKAVRKGATLVVADPRKIWLTKIAKRHLQLRPGTDVWLVNALMHVILEEELQNDAYIRENTEGFEAVRDVVARYTPEEAEKVTGVPAEEIVATAREYAAEKHAAIFYTLGITEHPCPGSAREDWRIVVDFAKALGGDWPDYRTPEDAWNEFADLSPLWTGIRYDRIEEVGLQWPCQDVSDPGTPCLHSPHPSRPNGKGKFYPVEFQPPIEQPDSEYPFVLSTGRT